MDTSRCDVVMVKLSEYRTPGREGVYDIPVSTGPWCYHNTLFHVDDESKHDILGLRGILTS